MAVQTSPSRRTTTGRPPGTAARSSSRSRGGTAGAAPGQTRRAAPTSADGSRQVTGAVRSQVLQLREDLALQGRTVVDQTRAKVQEGAQTQVRRAAGSLSRLAAEAQALVEGRPEEAETIRTYVAQGAEKLMDAADRIYGLADEVEASGVENLAKDLARFARRRPGVFLLGAAVAGFGVGRAVRSGDDGDDAEWDESWDDGDAGGEPAAVGRRAVAGRPRALAAGTDGSTR